MSDKNAATPNLQTYALIGIGGLILIYLGNQFDDKESHLMHVFCSFMIEMGMAFIIALIVIYTIERFQREHQNKFIQDSMQKISTHLFNTAYKKFIPDDVFNEFVECLSRSNVIRTDHEITYSLGKHPDQQNSELILCKAISRYTLKNITSDTIMQKIFLSLEKPLDPKHNEYCKVLSIEINGVQLSQTEINEKTVENPSNITFSTTIEIPIGGEATIISKAQLIKFKNDSENWELKHPSDGIRVELQCDPALNLNLHAKMRHSKSFKPRLDEDHQKSWELKHGTFPHQSVVLWWSKKNV